MARRCRTRRSRAPLFVAQTAPAAPAARGDNDVEEVPHPDDVAAAATGEEGEGEEEEEGLRCTLPEPHDHIFLVPPSLAGKECICPFTGVHFIAPSFADAALSRRATRTAQRRPAALESPAPTSVESTFQPTAILQNPL